MTHPTAQDGEQLDVRNICSADGGDHAWGDSNVIYACARPISKSSTIETRTCGKCEITRTVVRSGGGVEISDSPAGSAGKWTDPLGSSTSPAGP